MTPYQSGALSNWSAARRTWSRWESGVALLGVVAEVRAQASVEDVDDVVLLARQVGPER